MDKAIRQWLLERSLPNDVFLKLPYDNYGQMLLLPGSAFEGPRWTQIQDDCNAPNFNRLYELIARHLKVTHIAINKPIPLLEQDGCTENVLRAPRNFTPVFGDFGPETCSSPPTVADYQAAFWVTAKQHGVFQTWAPRWTMFSRGNISEKARIATLPSVRVAVEQGSADGRGCAAVDLYAGIGYFAFSYLTAGVDRVICWDLNPWSIEGLRRGAIANGWTTAIYSNDRPLEQFAFNQARLLVFNETNEHAMARIGELRAWLPPIRHVNCGLLPTSRGSWQMALAVIDPVLGGWVHVHENFAVKEIEEKVREVQVAFQGILAAFDGQRMVQVESVNHVKSYAPGVMHCVIDLFLPPLNLR